MTIYNALPRKEYGRVFIDKTAKEIWRTLIITHQGNSQVKNCKIDLLTQEYEKFSISNEETINSGFTHFNAIVTSLKSLDPDYSSKNHVRKFLRALPLRWRAKVTTIEESKDLATFSLDELIALKSKVTRDQTSDDIDSQGGSDEDVYEEEEAEALTCWLRTFASSSVRVIESGTIIDFSMVPIGLEKAVVIALGIKVVKAQSQKECATVAR
nr:UBN2 domain-containing protein [Tanacetum cinerariifolium]